LTSNNDPVSTTGKINNTTIATIESSLVDWWKLNEPSGNRSGELGHTLTDNNTVGSAVGKIQEEVTQDGDSVYTVIDKSGTNNNALQTTVTNQPTWTNAKELDFDGSTDFLNLDAVLNDVSSDTQGTWAVWVKPADITPSSNMCILSMQEDTQVTNFDIRIQNTSGKFTTYARDRSANKFLVETDSNPFTLNEWTHVAIVQDGVSPVLYVDGVAVAQTTTINTDTTYWNNSFTSLDNARIGMSEYNSATQFYFNGSIGEVVITSEALTSGQISDLYNSQKSVYA
jgi:hypothetical protein